MGNLLNIRGVSNAEDLPFDKRLLDIIAGRVQ